MPIFEITIVAKIVLFEAINIITQILIKKIREIYICFPFGANSNFNASFRDLFEDFFPQKLGVFWKNKVISTEPNSLSLTSRFARDFVVLAGILIF